jgi:hypothetical protein
MKRKEWKQLEKEKNKRNVKEREWEKFKKNEGNVGINEY